MYSPSDQNRPQILYGVFDEDYLIVCRRCYSDYHSEKPPSTWMDVVDEAQRAKESAPNCQICDQPFADSESGGKR